MSDIVLPWPTAQLSGHANGNWTPHAAVTAKHRLWARQGAQASNLPEIAPKGDIAIAVTFYPPDRRGDRVNFPNRIKPYWDGIADAMGVNDNRFLPSYHFAEPVKNPRVVFSIRSSEARPIGEIIAPIVERVTPPP